MKKVMFVLVAMLTIAFFAGSAFAIPVSLGVDFRSSAWSGANGQEFYTVGNVKATALPDDSKLFQDGTDGLGVLGGEDDEIDREERIRVNFDGVGMYLTGVWVTDLFAAPDGTTNSGEWGRVWINGTDSFSFFGNNSDQANGEQFVSFGGSILVTKAAFVIPVNGRECLDGQCNEYSVAGFTVPEPTTIFLLGLGLVGLAGMRRRFKR